MAKDYVLTTVTNAAASFDLTSLLNVKTDLKLSGAVPNDDIYIKRLIHRASQSVSQYCNRIFAQQTYQDLVRYKESYDLGNFINRRSDYMPKNLPLVSVSSVTENGTLLVAGTDYEVDLKNNLIHRLDSDGNPTVWQDFPLIVVYVAGYTLPPLDNATLPADIEDVTIRMIKRAWGDRNREGNLKVDDVQGVGRREYWIPNTADGNMTPDITDVLDNYRIMVIA